MTTILPYVAGSSITLAAGAVLYRIIRPRFNIRVNCWFCCKDTVVPYGNKDCWDCPHCEQYNGFAQDGDYNKPIPSQYYENMNHPVMAFQAEEDDDVYRDSRNVLCVACSRNQLLKIKQLADFVPYNEANYDTEVTMYKQQLEHTYRLCKTCHIKVKQSLNKQDQVLQRKMMKQRLKSPDSPSHCSDHFLHQMGTPAHIQLLRLTSILCAITLLVVNFHRLQEHSHTHLVNVQRFISKSAIKYLDRVYHMAHVVVFLGFFSGMIATFLSGKDRLVMWDALSSFVWLGLLFVHWNLASELTSLQPQDVHILQVALALLCILLSMLCSVVDRTPRSQRGNHVRRRHRRTNSFLSDASDVSRNTSPVSDRSPAPSEDFDSVSQVSNHNEASDHMAFQLANHTMTPSHVTKQSTNHGAGDIQSGHPIDSKLETMSLGPPSRRRAGKGAFDLNGAISSNQVTSTTPMPQRILGSLGKKRPLISPARFQASQGSLRSPQGGNHVTGGASTTPARRLFSSTHSYAGSGMGDWKGSEVNHSQKEAPEEESTSSSSSSLCPVGSSCPVENDDNINNQSKRSLLWQSIIGVSIGFNVAIAGYFAVSYLGIKVS